MSQTSVLFRFAGVLASLALAASAHSDVRSPLARAAGPEAASAVRQESVRAAPASDSEDGEAIPGSEAVAPPPYRSGLLPPAATPHVGPGGTKRLQFVSVDRFAALDEVWLDRLIERLELDDDAIIVTIRSLLLDCQTEIGRAVAAWRERGEPLLAEPAARSSQHPKYGEVWKTIDEELVKLRTAVDVAENRFFSTAETLLSQAQIDRLRLISIERAIERLIGGSSMHATAHSTVPLLLIWARVAPVSMFSEPHLPRHTHAAEEVRDLLVQRTRLLRRAKDRRPGVELALMSASSPEEATETMSRWDAMLAPIDRIDERIVERNSAFLAWAVEMLGDPAAQEIRRAHLASILPTWFPDPESIDSLFDLVTDRAAPDGQQSIALDAIRRHYNDERSKLESRLIQAADARSRIFRSMLVVADEHDRLNREITSVLAERRLLNSMTHESALAVLTPGQRVLLTTEPDVAVEAEPAR